MSPLCVVQFLSPKACYKFTDGQYPRTLYMQIIDRYGRQSNIISRNLVVETCEYTCSTALCYAVGHRLSALWRASVLDCYPPVHHLPVSGVDSLYSCVCSAAIIMYTSEVPVTVDNTAAFTSIQIKQSTFDPIHDSVNVTNT